MNHSELYEKFRYSNKEKLTKALRQACFDGDLDLVKYLLTSPNLKSHPELYWSSGSAIYWCFFRKQFAILEYLIFEFNIEKTEYIDKILDSYPKEVVAQPSYWFAMRDLNKLLDEELVVNETEDKKTKL